MKLTKKMILASALATMLLFASCSTTTTTNDTSSVVSEEISSEVQQEVQPEETSMTFNAETLAAYNGKDGARAYVAVNGVVYDVTDVPAWTDGGHNGQVAGVDITEMMESSSPHGISKVDSVPVVGTYQQ